MSLKWLNTFDTQSKRGFVLLQQSANATWTAFEWGEKVCENSVDGPFEREETLVAVYTMDGVVVTHSHTN